MPRWGSLGPTHGQNTVKSSKLMAATEALHPRWAPFILTGLLAGLRWGESAALMRSDIDFGRGRLHVQRTVSGRGAVAPPKKGRDRWVKASPALLQALRGHLEAIAGRLRRRVVARATADGLPDLERQPGQLPILPRESLEAPAESRQAHLPEVPRDPAQLCDLAPRCGRRHPVGAGSARARVDLANRRHLRAHPGRAA